MASDQEVNVASNHDGEPKPVHSELKIEMGPKDCSPAQSPIGEDDDKERIPSPIASSNGLNSDTDNAESEPKSNVQNVQSDSKKEVCELTSDDISWRETNISKDSSVALLEAKVSSRKRAFSLDIPGVLGYREQNLRFRPGKRSRFAIDDNLRIGRIDNLGPVSTNEVTLSPSKKVENSVSIIEMFDDAEGDQTFDLNSYKKAAKKSTSTIRADLVAAILGTPAKSTTTEMPINISFKDKKSRDDDQKRRRVTNKKLKKKSTAKERMAAVAILDGEIDLLRILPRDDCIFLGKKCFIFTLRQLEWLLNDDVNSDDSFSRQKGRKALTRQLRERYLMVDESKENSIANVPADDKRSRDDILTADKLEEWKRLIEIWKRENKGIGGNDQFPLVDGPMSVFFPVGTLQFMESMKVKVLFDFLCLKKTESGLAVEMFRAWRKRCGLKDLNLLPLAKHLIGINARIEASLKRKFDAEEEFMDWVAGPMVVLSGAAKEFLVDYSKVFSGTQFIETKTKLLADQFCDWRSKTGLSALRGSGNVAMISAWKTQIKDELEIEKSEGKVITEEEIGNEIESIPETVSAEKHNQRSKRRRVQQPVSRTDSIPQSAYDALNSTDFFSKFFGDERKLAMFRSVGITTAQNLIDSSKGKNSDLLKALVRLKTEQSDGKEIQIASCVSLLYEWCARMKKRINDIQKGKSDIVDNVVEKDQKSNVSRSWKKKRSSMDPFDALSKPSKEFLITSMNIRTAPEFLETRTTDIANAFIKWREDRGMPALKGLGAVASISGWKKLVRTKAASVGDLSLAELNKSRNTKSVVGVAEDGLPEVKNEMGGLDNQLDALGIIPAEGAQSISMKLKSKNILSVLSWQRKEIFHFELRTRKDQSKGTDTYYLIYLGNDPQPAPDANFDESVNDEKECTLVESNLDEKLCDFSGRKPYDSFTYGAIELSSPGYDPGVQPKEKGDGFGISLEEVIRFFVLESELCEEAESKDLVHRSGQGCCSSQTKMDETRKMFNVFEVIRNGKKAYMLHLTDPIERGQSVELRYLPLEEFDKSVVANGGTKTIRNLIQDRLQKLPVALLLQALRFLKSEVATLVALSLNGNDAPSQSEGQPSVSSSPSTKSIVARRRTHWLAVKIYENLRSIRPELVPRHMSTDLLWTKSYVDEFRDHLHTKNTIPKSIRLEIRHEIQHEFTRREFNGFASTLQIWCPLAKGLFEKIIDSFANLSIEVGGSCVGDDLTSKLSCLVSQCISNLKILLQCSQNGERGSLSTIALMYGEGTRHESNAFPSFQDIKQKYFLQPYVDAMTLCNEPVSMFYPIKNAQIVATKKTCEANKNKTTCFEDLHDFKIHEKNNVDVLWYVDTQVLAVALCAIHCGLSTNTAEDTTTTLRSIELQIMEAAHRALPESMRESLPFEDFKIQQRFVNSTLRSEVQKYSKFSRRSLATSSSLPFFFGFIWPLLRETGWKLTAGSVPTDVTFHSPAKFGSRNQVLHRRDSVARRRSQLAIQCSSIGLGYIPKLTRRLFVKCSEKSESSPAGLDRVSGPSTKVTLQKFESSLLLNVRRKGEGKNRAEQTKIQEIIAELTSLFNKLVPLTFEKEDECHRIDGKQWCDVLDCRYLFKFLIVLPGMLQEAHVPAQQNSHIICIVHELLTYLSNSHQTLFDEQLKLPNEEYHSESSFPSTLPSQIEKYSRKDLGLALGNSLEKENSENESVEIILPKDRADLTDFVATVMSQAIIGRSTVDHSSRHGQYRAGHPFIVCRHCLGARKGGKYFYGTYDSIATAVTAVEKHILRCTEIDEGVRQEVMKAKVNHAKQRKNLPFGSQSAFFVRLFDRMQSLAKTRHEPGSHESLIMTSSTIEKHPLAIRNGMRAKSGVIEQKTNTSRAFSSHLDVLEYIQSAEPWKSKKDLETVIAKYYSCLNYGGKVCGAKKSDSTFTSEWLYSKLSSKK